MFRRTKGRYGKILIIGTNPLGEATYNQLCCSKTVKPSNILGFLSWDEFPELSLSAPNLGPVDKLKDVLESHPICEVYLAGRVTDKACKMQKVIKVCEMYGTPFAIPSQSLEFDRARACNTARGDGYIHYLNVPHKPLQSHLKRALDILGSSIGLIFLSPLLIGVAIAIKMGSEGPVFFEQTRVGLHGSTFRLLKFRSMCQGADEMKENMLFANEMDGPVFKMKSDPRVTKIGRFIRKYSIDELPQLINILCGEMSIVGPRPPVPKEVVAYKPWQRRRLSVLPGLTCYWQTSGRNEVSFEEWMLMDMRYIDNWKLLKDVSLIFKTIPVVLTGRGAS